MRLLNQLDTTSHLLRKILIAVSMLIAACALSGGEALAQKIKFPYDAQVVTENAFARAGAGDTWFPTQRLPVGTIVTVHRHDAGGWFMISPPEGSFSWVAERYVKFNGPNEAEITEDNVVAYVGSEFGDDTTVWQRSLSKGTKLSILERRRLFTLSGEQAMVKVRPPAREYRWVPGATVVPVDENIRRQMDNNPYQMPSNAVRQSPDVVRQDTAGRDGAVDVPQLPANSQLARLKQIREAQQSLSDLDRRFREMITGNPENWDLDAIESAYQQLQQSVGYKPVAGQIDLRYPAIERYRRKLAELNDFKRLTSQTEQLDAQLVAQSLSRPFGVHVPPAANRAAIGYGPDASQQGATLVVQQIASPELDAFSHFAGMQGGLVGSGQPVTDDMYAWNEAEPATPPEQFMADGTLQMIESNGMILNETMPMASAANDDIVIPSDPANISVTDADINLAAAFSDPTTSFVSSATVTGPASPQTTTTTTRFSSDDSASSPFVSNAGAIAASPHTSTTQVRYVGAGIVQRATSGTPDTPYVLMTPAGRLLAHLKPEGSVNLEPFVGHAVGLHGSRWFKDELGSDYIEVTGLEPVKIRK